MRCGLVLTLVCSVLGTPSLADSYRLAVAEFASHDVKPELSAGVVELLAVELAKFTGVEVLTPADLRAVLTTAASHQLMGCDAPECFVDVAKFLPASRLVTGSVSKLDGQIVVTAALIDLQTSQVLGRASQSMNADADSIAAVMRSISIALLAPDPNSSVKDIVFQGEVTADLLDRVRIAQRSRVFGLHAYGGASLVASIFAADKLPRSNLGANGRLEAEYAIFPWLLATTSVGLTYNTGRYRDAIQYFVRNADGSIELAQGAFEGEARVYDGFLSAGLKLRQPYGLVLPYFKFSVGGDWLLLDIDDFEFREDAESPHPMPSFISETMPFDDSSSPGLSLRAGAGVDLLLLEHLGLSLELSAYQVFHGLEIVTNNANVVDKTPYPHITGFTVLGGLNWQF